MAHKKKLKRRNIKIYCLKEKSLGKDMYNTWLHIYRHGVVMGLAAHHRNIFTSSFHGNNIYLDRQSSLTIVVKRRKVIKTQAPINIYHAGNVREIFTGATNRSCLATVFIIGRY